MAVWFVARPFLGSQTAPVLEPDGPDRDLLALEEERDRALAALKELEFDHRTGKISDDDYRLIVGDLRKAAAQALCAVDSGIRGAMPKLYSQARVEIETPPPAGPPEPPGPVIVPEPSPVPHEPPGPVIVPEPEPVPHEPPGPAIVPEPTPPRSD